jgi:hypothetical protein
MAAYTSHVHRLQAQAEQRNHWEKLYCFSPQTRASRIDCTRDALLMREFSVREFAAVRQSKTRAALFIGNSYCELPLRDIHRGPPM